MMAVKTKPKSKVKPQAKAKAPVKTAVKSKPVLTKTPPKTEAKPKPIEKAADAKESGKAAKPATIVKRAIAPLLERRRPAKKHAQRSNQFNFMKAPNAEHQFQVGDIVEVFCDHEKNRDRIRGWVKGIVVQVDHKLAAVQFRSNVYLTDGWMVPDRILWFPLNSEHIRPVAGKKPADKKEFVIPDY